MGTVEASHRVDERNVAARLAQSLVELPYDTWGFGESVAFEALLEASDRLGDSRFRAFAHGVCRGWAARAEPYRELDCTAPGLSMVRLAERENDPHLMEAVVGLADHLCRRRRIGGVFATWERSPLMHPYGGGRLSARGAALVANPPAGVFVDCLHFDPPFLTALGIATGSQRYAHEGIAQAECYVRLLAADDGLFDHFMLENEPGTFGHGWGRGQGWALLGLLDVLALVRRRSLEDEHQAAVDMLSRAAAHLVEAMVSVQREDGHWPTVVTEPEAPVEHSTAAFMAVGFHRALELGLCTDPATVRDAAGRAVDATHRSVASDDTLSKVSAAVMACTDLSHYFNVPSGYRVAWGQGPALLALTIDGA